MLVSPSLQWVFAHRHLARDMLPRDLAAQAGEMTIQIDKSTLCRPWAVLGLTDHLGQHEETYLLMKIGGAARI